MPSDSFYAHNTLDGVRTVLRVLEKHRELMAQALKPT